MTSMVQACIALGSNLGDREKTVRSAVAAIAADHQSIVEAVSELIETEPVGMSSAPAFINAAARLRTSRTARELLDLLLAIEREHGRVRAAGPEWSSRTLDLDLLLYDDAVIHEPGLRVPHPRMHERFFVLQPLVQVAPNWVHPVLGVTITTLLSRTSDKVDPSATGF